MTKSQVWTTIDLSDDGAIAVAPKYPYSEPVTEAPKTHDDNAVTANDIAYHLGAIAKDAAKQAASNAINEAKATTTAVIQRESDPVVSGLKWLVATSAVIVLNAGVSIAGTAIASMDALTDFNPTNPMMWLKFFNWDLANTSKTSLDSLGYDSEQQQTIQTIIEVGDDLGATDNDITIAIAVCLVETQCREVKQEDSDRDSQGAFQQRTSMDWPNTLDTATQARAFFQGHGTNQGLFDVPNRIQDPGAAAQAVQASAYPDRYQQRMDDARAILEAVRGESQSLNTGDTLNKGDRVGPWIVTSGYGKREAPAHGASTFHKGIDLDTPTGTPLYAPYKTTVTCFDQPNGYGIYAAWNGGMAGHLSECSPGSYRQGEIFGATGDTGISTGPHLDARQGSGPNFQAPTRTYIEALLGVN